MTCPSRILPSALSLLVCTSNCHLLYLHLCPPHHLFLDKTLCLVCYLLRLGTLLAGLLLATHGCEFMQITHTHMDVNAYTHTESVEAKQVAQQEVRSAMQRVRSMF